MKMKVEVRFIDTHKNKIYTRKFDLYVDYLHFMLELDRQRYIVLEEKVTYDNKEA